MGAAVFAIAVVVAVIAVVVAALKKEYGKEREKAAAWRAAKKADFQKLSDEAIARYDIRPCRGCNERIFVIGGFSPTGRSLTLRCVACWKIVKCNALVDDVAPVSVSMQRALDGRPAYDSGLLYIQLDGGISGRPLGRQPISDATRRLVWQRDGGRCVQCGMTADLQFDHVIPYSKGGGGSAENVQLLCGPCNRKKSISI